MRHTPRVYPWSACGRGSKGDGLAFKTDDLRTAAGDVAGETVVRVSPTKRFHVRCAESAWRRSTPSLTRRDSV
jgi:hypothetical protein